MAADQLTQARALVRQLSLLKAEINEEALATLNSDNSSPLDKPASGRIAVKVINHRGDELMKVFKVR